VTRGVDGGEQASSWPLAERGVGGAQAAVRGEVRDLLAVVFMEERGAARTRTSEHPGAACGGTGRCDGIGNRGGVGVGGQGDRLRGSSHGARRLWLGVVLRSREAGGSVLGGRGTLREEEGGSWEENDSVGAHGGSWLQFQRKIGSLS
jgi:hypothetical protein